MKTRHLRALGALLLATTALAACAPSDETASNDISCEKVLTQAAYETMRQLAAAGLASDPAALRDALAGDTAPSEDAAVNVPEYRIFTEQYSDAEQATLLSALASSQSGIGVVFDSEAFYSATSLDGNCSGWLIAD